MSHDAFPPQYDTAVRNDFGGNNWNGNGDAFSDKAVRRGFIRKVYMILCAQLLVTGAFVAIFLTEPVSSWVRRNIWFYYISYATFMVTYIALVCCSSVRRKYPGNFIALSIFTLAFSYMAGTISSFYKTESVLVAVVITAIVCISLSLFATQTKIDFTKCTGLIFALSMVLVLSGLALTIFSYAFEYKKPLFILYSALAALVFSVYIIFDTQYIMGRHEYQLSPEEYIFGSLQVYMDIVQLFIIFLTLFGDRN